MGTEVTSTLRVELQRSFGCSSKSPTKFFQQHLGCRNLQFWPQSLLQRTLRLRKPPVRMVFRHGVRGLRPYKGRTFGLVGFEARHRVPARIDDTLSVSSNIALQHPNQAGRKQVFFHSVHCRWLISVGFEWVSEGPRLPQRQNACRIASYRRGEQGSM